LGPGDKVVFKKKHKKWWHVHWKYEPHRHLRGTRAANSGGKKCFSIVSFDSSRPSFPSYMMRVVVRPLMRHWHSFFFFFFFPLISSCLTLHIFMVAHQVIFHLFFSHLSWFLFVLFQLISQILFCFQLHSPLIFFLSNLIFIFLIFLFKIVF